MEYLALKVLTKLISYVLINYKPLYSCNIFDKMIFRSIIEVLRL